MTKYSPPNARKYNHPPTKKPKGAAAPPEVHITVNITPAGDVSSAPAPGPSHSNASHTRKPSTTLVLLDCINEQRVPTVNELLTIFEHEKPIIDTAEVLSELEDFAIRDVVDLYSLPVELLASFGGLGRDGAQCLQQFVLERLLGPLGLMDTHCSSMTVYTQGLKG